MKPEAAAEVPAIQEKRHNKAEIFLEGKKQLKLGGPLISVNLLLTLIQVISVSFIGQLGELSLSGASVATSFALVTGFSIVMGLSSALDTLCGQSYGAKQYHMLGIHTQRAMLVLLHVCIPISCIWATAEHILIFLRQDQEISAEAGHYLRALIPAIFFYSILQCLFKFLQTQNVVIPTFLSTGITSLLHILICWVLVFKTGLRSRGASMATVISYLINDLILVLYIWISPSCKNTWTGFSKEAFCDLQKFIKLAVPSAIMLCAEQWAFEVIVILAGLLPNPKLEISVLSISLNTSSMFFMIPFGHGIATSVRVSNELGAGQPGRAHLAVCISTFMVAVESILQAIIMILGRNVWGYCFSRDKVVVKYVARMMMLIAVMQLLNGVQCVLIGIARGCGWQKIGAIVNITSFYIIGIPLGAFLAFGRHVGGKGLWIGIIIAVSAQILILLVITIRTNWKKEAEKASASVHDSRHHQDSNTRMQSNRQQT